MALAEEGGAVKVMRDPGQAVMYRAFHSILPSFPVSPSHLLFPKSLTEKLLLPSVLCGPRSPRRKKYHAKGSVYQNTIPNYRLAMLTLVHITYLASFVSRFIKISSPS